MIEIRPDRGYSHNGGSMAKLLNPPGRMIVWFVVAIAAANWALIEFVNTDLLTDVLSLSGSTLTVTYGIIGAAAAINLYNMTLYEVMD